MLTAFVVVQVGVNLALLAGLIFLLREREAQAALRAEREGRLEALAAEFCALARDVAAAQPAAAPPPPPVPRPAAAALPDGEIDLLRRLRRPLRGARREAQPAAGGPAARRTGQAPERADARGRHGRTM